MKGTPDGGVHVVRGDPKLAEPLASRSETTTLFGDEVGQALFVAQNRLGDLHFVPADVKTVVGKLELLLYGSPLRLEDAVGAATTMSALRTAVREALVNEALSAGQTQFCCPLLQVFPAPDGGLSQPVGFGTESGQRGHAPVHPTYGRESGDGKCDPRQ